MNAKGRQLVSIGGSFWRINTTLSGTTRRKSCLPATVLPSSGLSYYTPHALSMSSCFHEKCLLPTCDSYHISFRGYAKGKDKPKTKNTQVTVNEEEIGSVVDVGSLKTHLNKLMEQMKDEFTKQLNVRGAAGALESLSVEFEGEVYPLQELAQVGRKNPQLAVLSMHSLPDAIQPVIKAIRDSGMNLNPQQEGTTIYVALPKVTREHREGMAKNAKAIFNKYRTNFHGVQNKFVKQCKNQKDVSEDLSFNVQQQIMKLTEMYVTDAEKLLHLKEAELLEKH